MIMKKVRDLLPKSGKGPDVYFPPPEPTEKLLQQKEIDEKLRSEREKKLFLENLKIFLSDGCCQSLEF